MPLTAEQMNQVKQLGLDWTKIDWTKVAAILQLLMQLFLAKQQDVKAALKAAGCPDTQCDLMCQAIQHNLDAANCCVECCC